ncbi:MAG TPA: hypothetical protein VLK36_11680 [Gaiellaceae bacterium]|nr:hypothetical protein [Gaiellaceae bacterium]
MAEAVEPSDGRPRSFKLAYAALALALGIAIAGFVVLLTRGQSRTQATESWSAWQPSDSGLLGAREIGHTVSAQYKTADGQQLAAVQEHLPEVQGLHLETIGVRRLLDTGQIDPYIGLFGTDRTLIYAFCGLRANCAVGDTSSPSQLLRREALELSLYAFKYLKGVDQVVSLVQGTSTGGPTAVFLRRSQLSSELDNPLRDTLPLSAPPREGATDEREAAVIDSLTLQNTFPAHFEPLPDGDAILVLDISSNG